MPKVHHALIVALAMCAVLALPAVATAARPGMTVKIPARQDVDNVYVLAAIHQKHCSLQVSGSVLGHRFKGFRDSSVTIHLTNQARLRLSAGAKRAVKRALKKGTDRPSEDHRGCAQQVWPAEYGHAERPASFVGAPEEA